MDITATSSTDLRQSQLRDWVELQLAEQQLPTHSDDSKTIPPITLTGLGGDAGFRRYFRFESPSRWLAVDAPPATEDSRQFVQLANALRQAGLKTPLIQAVDFTQGWLLVEDFGDALLFNLARVSSNKPADFYSSSFQSLLKLQSCSIEKLVPRYDELLLTRELEIFCEWFVDKLLKYELNVEEKGVIKAAFSVLVASALDQPQCLVHRDFHSRNLIKIDPPSNLDQETLGILDFQGATWGPCTYDLVSLLRDCYLRWPAEQVNDWVLTYRDLAIKNGLLENEITAPIYTGWFDLMGLQRHIKVLGIFARLSLRDHKPHYLKDLPLVLRYTLEVCVKYPQLSDFYKLFNENLLPLAQAQSWYQPWESAGEKS